jgi:hypothetical protein
VKALCQLWSIVGLLGSKVERAERMLGRSKSERVQRMESAMGAVLCAREGLAHAYFRAECSIKGSARQSEPTCVNPAERIAAARWGHQKKYYRRIALR